MVQAVFPDCSCERMLKWMQLDIPQSHIMIMHILKER